MFDAVFRKADRVASQFSASLTIVEQRGEEIQGLRLKLRLGTPELALLPWEYLYDSERREWLALRSRSPVVRFLDVAEPPRALQVDGPLRILGMIANPGGDWHKLDSERERHRIDEALKDLQKSGLVDFRWVPGDTSDKLLALLRSGSWHVFHFIGHGGISRDDEGNPEGFIVLADERGKAVHVPASRLKYPLALRSLRLAVLNCCEGGRGGPGDVFASPAAALVRDGVPTAVAMQFQISDEAAIDLASGFYGSLVHNLPIERALTEARNQIHMRSSVEWGIPVLYTRVPSGRVFSDVRAVAPSAMRSPFTAAELTRNDPLNEEQLRARERLRRIYEPAA
jgi:hypothetical protein